MDGNIFQANDIGLIRLFFPIKFVSKQIEPACLNLEEKKNYDDLLISGWGGKLRKNDLSHKKICLRYISLGYSKV